MMDKDSKKIYLISAVITAVVFLSGIWLSTIVNDQNVGTLRNNIKSLEDEIRQERLNLELIKEAPTGKKCKLLHIKMEELIKKIGEFQNKADYYEQHKKLDNPEYQEVKKNYMRLLIRHWLLNQDLERECGRTATTIFYFYTKPCEKCVDQGVVLTHFKNIHDENLLVYPFDMHLNVSSLEMLAKAYETDEYPSIVINENNTYKGFVSKTRLKEILTNETDLYQEKD